MILEALRATLDTWPYILIVLILISIPMFILSRYMIKECSELEKIVSNILQRNPDSNTAELKALRLILSRGHSIRYADNLILRVRDMTGKRGDVDRWYF